jgi:hypothetical protein
VSIVQKKKSFRNYWAPLVLTGVLCSIVVIIGLATAPAIRSQLAAWKVLPAPERFTALAFDNNLKLPQALMAAHQTFTFHIYNDEGVATSYPYIVTGTNSAGMRSIFATSQVSLASGANIAIPVSFVMPLGSGLSEVSVELPDQHQEIHFWLGKAQS